MTKNPWMKGRAVLSKKIPSNHWSRIVGTEFGDRDVAAHDAIFIDATGSAVKDRNGKRLLFYEMSNRHPIRGQPTISLTSAVLSSHTTPSIRGWLMDFRYHEELLLGYNRNIQSVMVVIYRSTTLWKAVQLELNKGESIRSSPDLHFRIVNGQADEHDFDFTFVLGCLSHIMKNYLVKIKQFIKTDVDFQAFSFSVLVNRKTLDHAEKIGIIVKYTRNSSCKERRRRKSKKERSTI